MNAILLIIVLSVFALIVSTLFTMYPESVIPIWFQIPIALFLGYFIKKGNNVILLSIFALTLMYGSVKQFLNKLDPRIETIIVFKVGLFNNNIIYKCMYWSGVTPRYKFI